MYEVERHRRLALSAACVVLVWFAAGMAGTWLATSLLRRLAVTVAVAALYVGLFDWGSHLATRLTVDSPALVWMPNFVFFTLAVALHLVRRRERSPSVRVA
jgi:lipopolysaccharide export LptBFGC system permease protein LptF